MSDYDTISQNIFTKRSSNNIDKLVDYTEGLDLNPSVVHLYHQYQEECNPYVSFALKQQDLSQSKIFYVYIWFAKTEPKRIFYVGKGCRTRYTHILRVVEKGRNPKEKNTRFKQYAVIADKWGIDYEIVINGLTEYEALLYEQCLKIKYLSDGEVLLNVEGIPQEYLPDGWVSMNTDTPSLQRSRFRSRYLDDCRIPVFDEVTFDGLLKPYLYMYFTVENNKTITEKEIITNWLKAQGNKLYSSVSKNTTSVIVFGYLPHDRYSEYYSSGKLIYSAEDVVEFIKKNPRKNTIDTVDEKQLALMKRETAIRSRITELLIKCGADSTKISYGHYHDEQIVYYMNGGIYFFVYKKKELNWVSVPLDLAGDVRDKLVRVNSWQGFFEFETLEQLNEIEPYVRNVILTAKTQ